MGPAGGGEETGGGVVKACVGVGCGAGPFSAVPQDLQVGRDIGNNAHFGHFTPIISGPSSPFFQGLEADIG